MTTTCTARPSTSTAAHPEPTSPAATSCTANGSGAHGVRDARVTLLQAYHVLTDIAADGFAERARAELAAVSETRLARRPPATAVT
jgi:hypothetical protein